MSSKSALSAVDFDTVRPLKAQVQRLELQLQQATQDIQRSKAVHDSQQQQSEQQYRRLEQAKSTLEEKARLREQEWKLELQAAVQNAKLEAASQVRFVSIVIRLSHHYVIDCVFRQERRQIIVRPSFELSVKRLIKNFARRELNSMKNYVVATPIGNRFAFTDFVKF
jgi:DNA repair exonuclease SbcCD ATPase subunit